MDVVITCCCSALGTVDFSLYITALVISRRPQAWRIAAAHSGSAICSAIETTALSWETSHRNPASPVSYFSRAWFPAIASRCRRPSPEVSMSALLYALLFFLLGKPGFHLAPHPTLYVWPIDK